MGSLHVSLAKRGVPDHLCWAWDFFLHAVILDRVRQSNQGGEVMEEDVAVKQEGAHERRWVHEQQSCHELLRDASIANDFRSPGALMKKAQRKYAIQQAYRMACNKRGTTEGCNLLRRRSCIF